jgi:hypothetical protein
MTTFGSFLPKFVRLLMAAATLLTLSQFSWTQLAQAQERQERPERQVLETRLAAPASAQLVGRLPSSQSLNLALTLPLRNPEELRRRLQGLYTPASPEYRKFLTVQQFTEQFGPTAADYQKVTSFAESHGLTVTNTAPNRLVLDVRGTVAAIEQAFQLKMQVYRHPTENRTYYAPSVEPSVEPGIPLQGVSGLNNFEPPRPIGLQRSPKGEILRSNQTGSGPDGEFLGSDMRAAYYGGTALTGAGQSIGLFEFGPYNLSDVQNYFSLVGQPLNVPIVNVLLDDVSPICSEGCDDGEEVIDIEQAISMAPGLSAIIVYEGNNDVDMFNQMATDNIAKQLSCSFGFLPADPSSDEPIFMEFAAQGQNLFVASGDSGAFDANNPVFYPADDPFITDVGGTDLTTVSAGGAWQSELAWSGSSGGITTDGFAIPSYQVPVINSANQGSTTLRNLPDVAAEANTDNIFCANGGCFEGVGGTSLAAPRWAGFMALANEQADGTPIGFLNPTIYTIGQSASYDNDFHDISSGNNNNGDGTSFNAVTGYDLVTGWGSPNGQNLLNALGPAPSGSAPNFALAPSPATLNLTQGASGTATIAVSALNGFSSSVNLRVTVLGSPAGVTASVSPVSVTGSGAAILSVSTSSATPGGNFQIVVSGTSGSLTQTAYVTLALPGFSLVASHGGSEFLNQNGINASQITISAVNGFHGKVSFAVSGVPRGVTATLTPASSRQSARLRLSAYPWAPTGFSTLTVTGTSGNITQTASINLAVSAARSGNGVGAEMDLSSAFNVAGIYTDGTTYSTGGLDGVGYSYSANLLGPERSLSGIHFKFGRKNQLDAVSGTGQPIPLHAAGPFSWLQMLGTGVEGDQINQPVTVTYTDGSTASFTLSFSDWFTPARFGREIEAVAMPYRDVSDGSQDNRTFNLYRYSIHLDITKTVQSITLPNNRNVLVLAVTLTNR